MKYPHIDPQFMDMIYPILFSILNNRGSAVFILGGKDFRVPGCTTSRTQWITESIAFRSKLKSARRMRVREPLGASMFRMLGISLASSNEQNNHFMYFVLFCLYLYNSLHIYIYIYPITQVIFQFNMQAPPFSAFKINGLIFRILHDRAVSRLENDKKTIATEVEGP